MKDFDECRVGERVGWTPTKPPRKEYAGLVVAHVRRGQNIYHIPGYDTNKASGNTQAIVEFDRVLVRAEHDGKWHAQPLKSLYIAPS